MDQRNMREIQVTWPLLFFIFALFALAFAIVAICMTMSDGEPYPITFLRVCYALAAGAVAVMVLAVLIRIHQAKSEQLPDGQPMSGWVLRQLFLGLILCVAGAIVMAVLAHLGATRKVSAIGGTAASGPGILLIGRALSSPI